MNARFKCANVQMALNSGCPISSNISATKGVALISKEQNSLLTENDSWVILEIVTRLTSARTLKPKRPDMGISQVLGSGSCPEPLHRRTVVQFTVPQNAHFANPGSSVFF